MLTGKQVNIISLAHKHLESLRAIRTDPKTYMFLGNIAPINEAMQLDWFNKISLDPTCFYLAIVTKKGQFAGIIRADEWDKINRSIRIGIDIVPKYRRLGFAYEAYQLLIKYIFHQLGLNRIWLLVLENNLPALALYKKLGFKKEGRQRQAIFRNNQFYDYLMLSLLAKQYKQP